MVYGILRLLYIVYFAGAGLLTLLILVKAILTFKLAPLKGLWVPWVWPLMLLVPRGRLTLKEVFEYAIRF